MSRLKCEGSPSYTGSLPRASRSALTIFSAFARVSSMLAPPEAIPAASPGEPRGTCCWVDPAARLLPCCCGCCAGFAPTKPLASDARCGSGLKAAKGACWALLGACPALPAAADVEGMSLDLSRLCLLEDDDDDEAGSWLLCLGEWWKMALLWMRKYRQ